jgi:ketosteroid isomerase-like protein
MITRFVVALCLLSSPSACLRAQSSTQQMSDTVSGTWFGEFVMTGPDGKITHDTAVLIVDRQGSTIKGSIGRTVDQQTAFRDGGFNGSRISFHLDANGGLDFVLAVQPGKLTGTATGANMKAEINLGPAPGLLPTKTLTKEITLADEQLYEAFAHCDVTQYSRFLSKDLEFYQDHTGKTNYEENLAALRNRCAEGIRLRRELDKDSLIIDAAPGFGAIEAGVHRFFSQNRDGSEHLDATARFTNVWSKETGAWKLVRVISYDHR